MHTIQEPHKPRTYRKKSIIGVNQLVQRTNGVHKINWLFLLLISIFFGTLGVDRFIMGQVGWGLLKLITGGGFGIWWLIDVILIACKYDFENVVWM